MSPVLLVPLPTLESGRGGPHDGLESVVRRLGTLVTPSVVHPRGLQTSAAGQRLLVLGPPDVLSEGDRELGPEILNVPLQLVVNFVLGRTSPATEMLLHAVDVPLDVLAEAGGTP